VKMMGFFWNIFFLLYILCFGGGGVEGEGTERGKERGRGERKEL